MDHLHRYVLCQTIGYLFPLSRNLLTCREQGDPGTSTLVMPRRVGVRSHRFMSVVLLHRQVDLLVLLQDMDLELAVGKARRPLFSLDPSKGSPHLRLQSRGPRLHSFRPREHRHHDLDVVDVPDDVP